MSNPELKSTSESDIEQIGQVRWGFERSGYAGGLEALSEKLNPLNAKYFSVMIFAREVAIATTHPQAIQADPREVAQKLIERGLITEEERDYVYRQFGFNPEQFSPPTTR